ncbi:universal stress protein [Anaerobacillus arseniciselenatis]|uniref:Universal stress protein n=1 Tax=Anaerobacillus arseniciselenatis TaxID=85682 RepID=A0A1S2LQB8_9BACI|nr:universal stress protein [Anaerobacillus arseniciselenatis]OIJ14524.1 universal stress protein [Anaerobacillus arseniciselenatis]
MYKKILLAYDGSEHSKRAAENAIKIAKCNSESKVEIVYVVDSNKAKHDVLNNWNTMSLEEKRKELLTGVTKIATDEGVEYTIQILQGEAGPSIIKYANDNDVDLLIIGSRGLDGIQGFVLGSVSHKVAKRANCPVMIVK